jgi:outer membrane protein OmpA-like peptidoglycan-associated protein
MTMAAPLLLTALGRRVQERHMTPSTLQSDLMNEAAGVRDLLPSGLTSLFGGVTRAATEVPRVAYATPGSVHVEEPRTNWMLPALLIMAGLIGMIWLFSRACTARTDVSRVGTEVESTAVRARDAVSSAADQARAGVAGLGAVISRNLPGNVSLSFPERGVEGRLLAFIQGPEAISRDRWFDFDRLVFDTNSATLRPESQEQLQNIAAILKAYPTVKMKIGGYTDNTGDAASNQKLSEARARNVRDELIQMGVPASRLQAQGYGQQHPVADNSTEEGRLQNRRISMSVLEK